MAEQECCLKRYLKLRDSWGHAVALRKQAGGGGTCTRGSAPKARHSKVAGTMRWQRHSAVLQRQGRRLPGLRPRR